MQVLFSTSENNMTHLTAWIVRLNNNSQISVNHAICSATPLCSVHQDLTRHPLSRRTSTVTWGRLTLMGSFCQDSEGLEKSTDWLSFSIRQVFYNFNKRLLKNTIQIFNLLSSNSPKQL